MERKDSRFQKAHGIIFAAVGCFIGAEHGRHELLSVEPEAAPVPVAVLHNSHGADPEEIMKSENIGIGDTDEVEAVVLAVIAEHHSAVADYKKGKVASLQFLIGQAMGKLKGRARPEMLREIFEKNLQS